MHYTRAFLQLFLITPAAEISLSLAAALRAYSLFFLLRRLGGNSPLVGNRKSSSTVDWLPDPSSCATERKRKSRGMRGIERKPLVTEIKEALYARGERLIYGYYLSTSERTPARLFIALSLSLRHLISRSLIPFMAFKPDYTQGFYIYIQRNWRRLLWTAYFHI